MKDRISNILKINHLTQKDFAKKISASPGNVNEWIKGRSEPGAMMLRRISEIFDIDANWLLTGEGEMKKKDYIPVGMCREEYLEYNAKFQKERALLDQKIKILDDALEDLEKKDRDLLVDSFISIAKLKAGT